jgi:hypothetical protein
MEVQLTATDSLMGVIIFITGIVALLVLLGLGTMMAIGAIFGKRQHVSSWPNEQEMAFYNYEQRNNSSQSKAWGVSLVTAIAVFVLAVGIWAGVEPDKRDFSKDMNMSNLSRSKQSSETQPSASQPSAPKEEAKPAAPAEAPPADKTDKK